MTATLIKKVKKNTIMQSLFTYLSAHSWVQRATGIVIGTKSLLNDNIVARNSLVGRGMHGFLRVVLTVV